MVLAHENGREPNNVIRLTLKPYIDGCQIPWCGDGPSAMTLCACDCLSYGQLAARVRAHNVRENSGEGASQGDKGERVARHRRCAGVGEPMWRSKKRHESATSGR